MGDEGTEVWGVGEGGGGRGWGWGVGGEGVFPSFLFFYCHPARTETPLPLTPLVPFFYKTITNMDVMATYKTNIKGTKQIRLAREWYHWKAHCKYITQYRFLIFILSL
jgi:hypothetical protein